MVDWQRPLKMADGSKAILAAVLHDSGGVTTLSARPLSAEEKDHFSQRMNRGVRYAVYAERNQSQLVYYRPDGMPWMEHHGPISNGPGRAASLEERAHNAAMHEELRERRRREAKAALNARRAAQAPADAWPESNVSEDAMRANPLWGSF